MHLVASIIVLLIGLIQCQIIPTNTTTTTTPPGHGHSHGAGGGSHSHTRRAYKMIYLVDTSYADFSTIRPEMSLANSSKLGYIYSFRGLVMGVSGDKDIINDCEEMITIDSEGKYQFDNVGDNVIGEFFAESTLYKNPSKDAKIKEWFEIISQGCNAPSKMTGFLTQNPYYLGSPLGVNTYHLSMYGPNGYRDRTQIHLQGMYTIEPPLATHSSHRSFMEFTSTSSSAVHTTNSQAAYDLSFVGHSIQLNTTGTPTTIGTVHRLVVPYVLFGYPKTIQVEGQLLDGVDI